jgi:hypothetical protein
MSDETAASDLRPAVPPVRRASASPLDHCSTSGAPVQIALPRTPRRGRPSAIRQWLIPLPTLT